MKRKIKLSALLIAVTVAIAPSCKKNNDKNDNTTKTKTELLTTGTWKFTAAAISPAYDYYGDGHSVTDIFSIMKPCEKDDYEIYKTNGIWEYHEGPTTCYPLNPQEFSDSWHFAANETKLVVGTDEISILDLTATTLKLRYTFEDAGITYTEEDTYGH